MKKVLIIKNVEREGPGLVADVLDAAGLDSDVVELDRGQTIPKVADYRAVVVMGGPASANDSSTIMLHELAAVEEVLAAGIPYLGICLGMQVLVKAAGGAVQPARAKEVGFRDRSDRDFVLSVTDAGGEDPLLVGLPAHFPVFQLHGETVQLTSDMTVLATGHGCRNQIVRVAPGAYGLQPHVELTADLLANWAVQDPDLQPLGAAALARDFAAIRPSYNQVGTRLIHNFLYVAGLIG